MGFSLGGIGNAIGSVFKGASSAVKTFGKDAIMKKGRHMKDLLCMNNLCDATLQIWSSSVHDREKRQQKLTWMRRVNKEIHTEVQQNSEIHAKTTS